MPKRKQYATHRRLPEIGLANLAVMLPLPPLFVAFFPQC